MTNSKVSKYDYNKPELFVYWLLNHYDDINDKIEYT
jgi:hypothetical protein